MINKIESRKIGISLFKIIMGFLIVQNMFRYMNYSDLLFGVDGIAPYERYTAILEMYGLSFMENLFIVFSPDSYLWMVVILTVLFCIGIGKWFVGVLLYFAILNLHLRNHLILDGSDSVILVSLPFIIFADQGSSFFYNWPDFKFEQSGLMKHVRKLATWGFMIQICIIYLATGLVKSKYDVWHEGVANYYILQLHEYEATKWNILLANNPLFVKITTYFTLVFEILFPIAVLFRKSKYLWLFFGLMFHVGIWIFMKLVVFPWIMIATYAVFISDKEYLQWYSFFKAKFSERYSETKVSERSMNV